MSPTPTKHRRQISIKIPPDIDIKLQEAISSGEFTNTTDAIMTGLRFYYQFSDMNALQKTLVMLQHNIEVLEMRCELLEKKVCELEVKNK